MKIQLDMLKLPKKVFLVMAVLVTLGIAIDSAFHASHVLVFFSLIILSVLFFKASWWISRHAHHRPSEIQ